MAEVVLDQAEADARGLGDVGHPDGVDPSLGDNQHRGVEDLHTTVGRVRGAHGRDHIARLNNIYCVEHNNAYYRVPTAERGAP